MFEYKTNHYNHSACKKMQMFATLDKANPDTGNINFAAVKHTTVHLSGLLL
jgi:hypothetical protein